MGHLWVQAVGQVKSAEVCGELHIHTHDIHSDGQYQPAQLPPLVTHANTHAGCQPCGDTLSGVLSVSSSENIVERNVVLCLEILYFFIFFVFVSYCIIL